VHQVSGKALYKDFTVDLTYGESTLGRPGGKHITTVGTCGRCHYTADDREKVQGLQSSINFRRKVTDDWAVFAEVYTSFKRRVVELRDDFSGELEPSLGKRRRVGSEARVTYAHDSMALTAGMEAISDGVNTINVLPAAASGIHATTVGAFVDGEWKPFEKWTLVAGARYDHPLLPEELWLRPESHLSPRAAIRFEPTPEIALRTSYGRAFRAPSLAELAIQQQMYAATLLGNPDLKAETLDVAELSVDTHPFGDTLRLTTTGFFKYASQLIGQELIAGSSSRFANVGNARIWGLETEARVKVPGSPTVLHLAYQLLSAKTLDQGSTPGAPLDYAPGHRLSLRAHTSFQELFFFDVYGLYVGTRNDPGLLTDETGAVSGHVQLPDYFVASARAGTQLAPGLTFSLLGTNLFNARYEESFGFPSPGLSLFGELRYLY
jgi:outer membrane receptor protein involved in Fe transport